jgi:hypothetical protein
VAVAAPFESGGFVVLFRAWLFQPKDAGEAVGAADTVAWPQGLLGRQALQDSHPDNVMAVQTRPVKAIPGFVPIGFSFLHG